MKKAIRTAAYLILAIAAAACAKAVTEGPNGDKIRYFESWMKVNYPDLKPTGLGIYVIEEEEGTGVEVQAEGFLYADFTITDLEGNITSYTDKETAKQLGTYDTTSYYGPKVLSTVKNAMQAGLADAVIGMKAGGRKKVIIPSWLMSYKTYDSEEEYRKNTSSGSNTIYDITIRDYTDSIPKHEVSLIEQYISEHPETFDSKMTNDTTGFYYQVLEPGTSEEKFGNDTTIYINYTGRLLTGLVFDTTDEKTAKDNGLYSPSRSYEPVEIHWGEKFSDLKMGSDKSTVISGFALTLWQMHPMEKGIGVFYSPLGYSYNGSGESIPGYAPLIFEIEIVDKPEE